MNGRLSQTFKLIRFGSLQIKHNFILTILDIMKNGINRFFRAIKKCHFAIQVVVSFT